MTVNLLWVLNLLPSSVTKKLWNITLWVPDRDWALPISTQMLDSVFVGKLKHWSGVIRKRFCDAKLATHKKPTNSYKFSTFLTYIWSPRNGSVIHLFNGLIICGFLRVASQWLSKRCEIAIKCTMSIMFYLSTLSVGWWSQNQEINNLWLLLLSTGPFFRVANTNCFHKMYKVFLSIWRDEKDKSRSREFINTCTSQQSTRNSKQILTFWYSLL